VWLLQSLESAANVIVGGVGLLVMGGTPRLPLSLFAVSGAAQVSAKGFFSLALTNSVSFPVATLAKSGKMVRRTWRH
jgi:UDP-galactose transporter B1